MSLTAENDETNAKYEVNMPLLTTNSVSHAHRQQSTKQTRNDDGVIELLEDVSPEESKKRNINFENGSEKNVTSKAVTWPDSNTPSTYNTHKQACDNGQKLVSHPPRYLPAVPFANTFTAMMQNMSHPNNIYYNNPSMLNAPIQYMSSPSFRPVGQKQRQQQFVPPPQHSQTRQQSFNPPPPPPPPPTNNYLKNYVSLLRSVIGVRVPHLVSVESYYKVYPVSDMLI